jgi:hypothetical protein
VSACQQVRGVRPLAPPLPPHNLNMSMYDAPLGVGLLAMTDPGGGEGGGGGEEGGGWGFLDPSLT